MNRQSIKIMGHLFTQIQETITDARKSGMRDSFIASVACFISACQKNIMRKTQSDNAIHFLYVDVAGQVMN